MLLLCVWPPDPLSSVRLGSFEVQHIYLRGSEERGRSGCQKKVIVLLTASSAVEGHLRQAHNVAASAGPEQRTVIYGHAGKPTTFSPPPPPSSTSRSLHETEPCLWPSIFISVFNSMMWELSELFFLSSTLQSMLC